MNRSFARTFRSPAITGTGATPAIHPSGRDAFGDRIWRGVGAGEETVTGESHPVLWFVAGAALGGVVVGIYSVTDSGPIGHLKGTLKGMRGKFGVSS